MNDFFLSFLEDTHGSGVLWVIGGNLLFFCLTLFVFLDSTNRQNVSSILYSQLYSSLDICLNCVIPLFMEWLECLVSIALATESYVLGKAKLVHWRLACQSECRIAAFWAENCKVDHNVKVLAKSQNALGLTVYVNITTSGYCLFHPTPHRLTFYCLNHNPSSIV